MQAPTLLIVEDEERMRRLFELVLKPAGRQPHADRATPEHDAAHPQAQGEQAGPVAFLHGGQREAWRFHEANINSGDASMSRPRFCATVQPSSLTESLP